MSSLSKAVMTYVTGLLLIIGIAAAVTSYHFVKYEVNSFQDNALQEVALNAGLIYRHDIEPRIDAELEDQLVVQIWDHNGNALHRSGPPVDMPFQTNVGYSNVTAGGENWRVFRANDSVHSVQISQRWSAREEVAAYAAAGAVLPLIASIPLAWLLIGWSVRRVLRGLGDLSADIAQRGTDAKDALSVSGVPSEITPLVSAMNTLIGRHQSALDAQRRFVSDAAHELRTPLAALQIQIDNLRARDLTALLREMADDLLGGIRRAVYLANQLLMTARTDAALEEAPEPVDVSAIVNLTLGGMQPLADTKEIAVSADLADGLTVTTRGSDLQLVLSNLIENALRYTDAGGVVAVSAQRTEAGVLVEVIDTGRGIPEDALPKIYDRFFRAVPQEIEGTGLGLAIAKTAADRNGITLRIANRTDRTGVQAVVGILDRPPDFRVSI